MKFKLVETVEFQTLDQIITKYSIPEDNQLNLFGEM